MLSAMTHRFSILLLLVSIIWVGCAPDGPPPPMKPKEVKYCGSVTALKDGNYWEASVYPTVVDTGGLFGLHFILYGSAGVADEYLSIRNVKAVAGIQQRIFEGASYQSDTTGMHFTLANGDAVYGSYDLVPSDTSAYIFVDSLSAKKVWGRFDNMTLVFEWADHTPPGYPDTLQISNGVFEACFKE